MARVLRCFTGRSGMSSRTKQGCRWLIFLRLIVCMLTITLPPAALLGIGVHNIRQHSDEYAPWAAQVAAR